MMNTRIRIQKMAINILGQRPAIVKSVSFPFQSDCLFFPRVCGKLTPVLYVDEERVLWMMNDVVFLCNELEGRPPCDRQPQRKNGKVMLAGAPIT